MSAVAYPVPLGHILGETTPFAALPSPFSRHVTEFGVAVLGLVSKLLTKKAGVVALIGGGLVGGFGLGGCEAFRSASQAMLEAQAGTTIIREGQIVDTYALDQLCIGGITSDVGLVTRVEVEKFGVNPGIDVNAPSLNMTTILCTDKKTVTRKTIIANGTDPHITITLPEKYTAYTFPSKAIDPTAFTTSSNAAAMGFSALNNLGKNVGGLFGNPIPGTSDFMQNLAIQTTVLAAGDYSVKQCVNPAWQTLKDKTTETQKISVARAFNDDKAALAAKYPNLRDATPNDVTVEAPKTITVTSQYQKQIDFLNAAASTGYKTGSGDTLYVALPGQGAMGNLPKPVPKCNPEPLTPEQASGLKATQGGQ